MESQNADEKTDSAVALPQLVRRLPRKDSACGFKTKLGRNYVKEANKMSKKWKKRYLVYRCPYCGDAHMTTKIRKRGEYATEVLHITPTNVQVEQPGPSPTPDSTDK